MSDNGKVSYTDEDIKALASLVASASQYYRKCGFSFSDSLKKARVDGADLLGVDNIEFNRIYGGYIRKGRKNTRHCYVSKSKEEVTIMNIPDVHVSDEDPFLEQEFVAELADKFKGMKAGDVVYQIYPNADEMKVVVGLMSRVAGRLKWVHYRTFAKDTTLYVKRVK